MDVASLNLHIYLSSRLTYSWRWLQNIRYFNLQNVTLESNKAHRNKILSKSLSFNVQLKKKKKKKKNGESLQYDELEANFAHPLHVWITQGIQAQWTICNWLFDRAMEKFYSNRGQY